VAFTSLKTIVLWILAMLDIGLIRLQRVEKMMSKFLIAFLALILILSQTPVHAQDSEGWFVYILDPVEFNLIRVQQDGIAEPFSLGVLEGQYIYNWNIHISDDGTKVAFCKTIQGQNGAINHIFIFRDIATETNLLTIPFSNTNGCAAGALSGDNSVIAVGIVNYAPYAPPAVLPDKPVWELLLIDLTNGDVISSLDADSSMAPDVESIDLFRGGVPMLPHAVEVSAERSALSGYPGLGVMVP
jgi:hypothetical protein